MRGPWLAALAMLPGAALADVAAPTEAPPPRSTHAAGATREPGCALDDGLYVRSNDRRSRPPRFEAARFVLASVDNRNQTYLLTAFTSDGGRPRVRLCLGAAEIASHGWGRPPDEGSISFLLRGALADRAAAALHLDRRDRHPLGLGMRWRFVVPARVRAGVPATVVLVGENSGSETVFFDTGGVHLGWNPDHRHRFGVWLDGKLPPDGEGRVNLDGVVTRVEPGPGGESRFEEPLERWPALERPGSYRVICRFETELHPSGEPADWARTDLAWDVVYESEATVEVVP